LSRIPGYDPRPVCGQSAALHELPSPRLSAKGPTARLTISDWADETTPAGPVGQETLINFIEIQPYLED